MPGKVTAPALKLFKQEKRKIVCATAYDALEASLLEAAEVDLILVGDSVANTKLGEHSTLGVTLEIMEHHVSAAAKGCDRALLVADMPFGSYQTSLEAAIESAVRLMQCGAEAVKFEGPYFEEGAHMVKAGIPFIGHLGMTPQSINVFGGHKVQGKDSEAAALILDSAKRLEDAGASAIVLELIPKDVSRQITSALTIPTIGIGAGIHCDGQIQVLMDLLGLSEHQYKHAKRYVDARSLFHIALSEYAKDVREGTFPTAENSF